MNSTIIDKAITMFAPLLGKVATNVKKNSHVPIYKVDGCTSPTEFMVASIIGKAGQSWLSDVEPS